MATNLTKITFDALTLLNLLNGKPANSVADKGVAECYTSSGSTLLVNHQSQKYEIIWKILPVTRHFLKHGLSILLVCDL